jgi:hypothetical protein
MLRHCERSNPFISTREDMDRFASAHGTYGAFKPWRFKTAGERVQPLVTDRASFDRLFHHPVI